GAEPMSGHVSRLAAEVRTATLPFLRTEQRDAFTRIREPLPPEDQMLLVLRIDRDLPWIALARIVHADANTEESPPADHGEETLKRETARLRKRFQLLKEKLVEIGRREGLITP